MGAKGSVPYPFSTSDETTDIEFIVEEKRIHFTKAILSMCSPVFRAMFAADFLEKEANEIPLPGKKYADIVELFKHLHPAYGPMTQVKDNSLLTLLELADEYQIHSVKEKCQQFIGHQAELAQAASKHSFTESFSVYSNLLYLLVGDRFQLLTHQDELVALAAMRKPVKTLTECPLFKQFEHNSMVHVLRKKCEKLEAELLDKGPRPRW